MLGLGNNLGNNSDGSGAIKATLIAKIDQRVIPALDRVATANETTTAQLMSQFFGDVTDLVQFLDSSQGDSFIAIEDKFAELIIKRYRGTKPSALRAMGRIWDRAAELKAQEGGGKG